VSPDARADAAEAIRQAALRYCRGVDRLDEALMRSAYHDDATDDHGVFVGPASELCARVVRSHRRYESTMHCVLNHAIEVADDEHASGEVYNVTYLLRRDPDGSCHLDTWWGRYLDQYERRDGRWAITHRTCVHEWTRSEPLGPAMPIDAQRFRQGSADRG
jgi:ketosteroid isomerase-like protein